MVLILLFPVEEGVGGCGTRSGRGGRGLAGLVRGGR